MDNLPSCGKTVKVDIVFSMCSAAALSQPLCNERNASGCHYCRLDRRGHHFFRKFVKVVGIGTFVIDESSPREILMLSSQGNGDIDTALQDFQKAAEIGSTSQASLAKAAEAAVQKARAEAKKRDDADRSNSPRLDDVFSNVHGESTLLMY